MLRGAEIVLQCLRAEGVDLVFGYPGGAIMPLYDALEGSGIKHILTRHEQGAVFGATGCKGDSNLSADARHAFRRENCSLLMPRENVLDPAAFESVIQRHDRAARIAEHQVNALGTQALQNDFGSSKHSRPSPRFSALSRASSYLSVAMTSCR